MNQEFLSKYTEKSKRLSKIKYDRSHFIKNRVVFYGTGKQAQIITASLITNFRINIVAFADSYKTGTMEFEIKNKTRVFPIIKVDDLQKDYSDCSIVICVMREDAVSEIQDVLKKSDISDDRVFTYFQFRKVRDLEIAFDENLVLESYSKAYDLFKDEISQDIIISLALMKTGYDSEIMHKTYNEQYFDVFYCSEEEIFIDGGFFDGDTLKRFISITNNKFKKYYGFEIDKYNLKNYIDNDERIKVINKGLWSINTRFKINATMGVCSNVSNIDMTYNLSTDKADEACNVITLDSLFESKPDSEQPTFIKMDIEGAEKEALLGCENIISKYKPKLAICVYHKLQDIYELPLLIKSFNPEYKIMLRHYTEDYAETVLYAAVDQIK